MPRPRRRELLGKRVTGYLNWTRARSYVHDMGALEQIVTDLKAHHPDHVAMTGDISNIGLLAEFQLAHSWLETLGPTSEVSFVPGNHDAYVRGSMPDLARVFAPWTKADEPGADTYPYLRVRGPVALVGLSSGVPTPFFIASGRLGQRQLATCEELLVETGRRGLVRIVMIHHPPMNRPTNMARGLADARDFEAMLRRAGAELVIHGHEHRLSVAWLKGNGRKVPVVGVASASMKRALTTNRAAYNLYEISGSGSDCRIEGRARGLLPGTNVVGDLGPIDLR
jgi:3',5'-cyclic AMP phosphodiesterase CpdA